MVGALTLLFRMGLQSLQSFFVWCGPFSMETHISYVYLKIVQSPGVPGASMIVDARAEFALGTHSNRASCYSCEY